MKLRFGKIITGTLPKLPKGKLTLGAMPLGKFARGKATGGASGVKKGGAKSMLRGIPVNRATLALGSGAAIFAIGFVMQNFGGHPAADQLRHAEAIARVNAPANTPANTTPPNSKHTADLSTAQVLPQTASVSELTSALGLANVTPTSSAILPDDAPPAALPQDRIAALQIEPEAEPAPLEVALLQDADAPNPFQTSPEDTAGILVAAAAPMQVAPDTAPSSVPSTACDITMTADPAPTAMADLMVTASCLPDARFTLHHNGMMFHALTDANGQSKLRVPALSENAVFIASFANGEGAVAQIDVPTLAFYDRVVVQWHGNAGLGLHALEFGATYFDKGHIFSGAPGNMKDAANGTSGFLSRFGHDTGPAALMAEIYTFPTRTSENDGQIGLSIEAEVTSANCDREIDAQTLQLTPGQALRTNDLTLYMPACDASGDFLVLNNLLQDLKVARN